MKDQVHRFTWLDTTFPKTYTTYTYTFDLSSGLQRSTFIILSRLLVTLRGCDQLSCSQRITYISVRVLISTKIMALYFGVQEEQIAQLIGFVRENPNGLGGF